jgi:glutaredoxin
MKLKKLLLLCLLFSLPFFLIACGTTADNDTQQPTSPTSWQKINDNIYTYYYGQACGHCKKVEDYLKKSGVDQRINIIPKEITLPANQNNREECLATAEELGIPISEVGTPFVIVTEPNGNKYGLMGEDKVLEHFKTLEEQIKKLKS